MTLLAWNQYLELLKPAEELLALTAEPDDERMRAELYRQLLMNLSLGYFLYFQADPAHPDWTPFLNSVFLLQPNPDDTYYLAPICGEGSYRISGERGSVHLLLFTIGKDMMGMSDAPGATFANHDADALSLGDDGAFEVLLSRERPSDHTGDWWELHPEATYIMVRQRSYDWGSERDARLAIERLDYQAPAARMQPAEIDRRMRELCGGFVERLSRMWLQYQGALRSRELVNRLELTTFGGAVNAQAYWQTLFELAPDEALILEVQLPEQCRYWNVQLNDPLFNAIDYLQHQSSLNGLQAHIDPDGCFRAVVALQDPGVANWLDTGGFCQGTLIGRWYEASSHPLPTLTRVPLSAVREHLPAASPPVSAEARRVLMAARRRGAQLRRRW